MKIEKKSRHTNMPMSPRTDGRAPGGRVQSTRGEMRVWKTRYARDMKEKKGRVEPEKEKEKEEDKLELFFYKLHEFHNPVPNASVFVPAELPPRYVINFVPAAPTVLASPVVPVDDVPCDEISDVNALGASSSTSQYDVFLLPFAHCTDIATST